MDFFKIREIIQSHLNESAAQEKDLDPNAKVVVKGTKGMNSKSFTKKFKNMAAADKWMDDNEDDIEVQQVMNESEDDDGEIIDEKEVKKKKDDPCWDGYVQLGTKKKDGKEVPNCVPMDEALQEAQKRFGVQSLSEKKSGGDDAYDKFFDKALKKFGVDDPSELSKEKKKEFFDYVDKNWKGDDE